MNQNTNKSAHYLCESSLIPRLSCAQEPGSKVSAKEALKTPFQDFKLLHWYIMHRHVYEYCTMEKDIVCFEVKISEKVSSRRKSNPGHLACAVCHWATTTGQPPAPTILFIHCTGGTEMPLFYTLQPLSMCCQNFIRGWPENSLQCFLLTFRLN